MPGKDFSDKIGHSPSPAIERAVENSKNVQQPESSVTAALNNAYNRHPVPMGDLDKKQS